MRILYLAFVDGGYTQLFHKIDQQFKILCSLNSDSHCYVIGNMDGQTASDHYSFQAVNMSNQSGREANFLLADKIAMQIRPDIIYFRYPFFDAFTYEFVCKHNNVVFEIQSIAANEVDARMASVELGFGPKILEKVLGIVSVTQELADYELARSPKRFPTFILSNGIDVAALPFSNSPAYADHLDLLCLANFAPWLGYDRLIAGLAEYPHKNRVTLHFAGIGPELEKYVSLVQANRLEQNCIFYGNLSREAVDTLANRCHIGIGTLALHRKGMRQMCALKHREYCLRGLPFIFAGSDVDFDPLLPFVRVLPANDAPVDFSIIDDLVTAVASKPKIRVEERQYALEKLSWEYKIANLYKFLSSLKQSAETVSPVKTGEADEIHLADNRDAVSGTGSRVLIACTHFWPSIGGVETIAENLGSRLVQTGYRVDVATWTYPGRSSDQRCGMRIISLDTPQVQNGVPLWLLQLRQMVVSGDYTACILLADPRNQVIWSVEGAAVPSGTRLIIQPIINKDGYGEWRENREFRRRLAGVLKQADAVISLTRSGPESVFMQEEGIIPVYLPNAVAEVAPVSDFRREYGIDDHEFLILHVANLWPVKNQPALIRTISKLSGTWRLVVIGHPSPETAYVASVGDAIAAEPQATLIQGLPPEKVAAAMSAADVVVLASLGEVAPVTILEAMSHRTPWLATPECGSVHDLAGGIVTPLAAFPSVLDVLRSDRNLRRELGSIGYDHWHECYRWDSVAPQWDRLIRSGNVSSTFDMPEAVARRMKELHSELLGDKTAESRPLVSVIVPTHDRPSMLATAIKSILAQTFQDFEIIVVNDAGKDVEHVVAAFNSSKIRYIVHDANKGLAAARNTGIRAANGKYIAYLDDDDIYYPHHLETLIGFLKNSGEKVAYSDACKGIQEQRGNDFMTVKREGFPSQDFDSDAILVDNFIPVLCVVHEKLCMDASGMFDETLPRHEDWDLWIRMSRTCRFAHIHTVTCEFTFRSDGSGMTSGTMPRFLETYRKIYTKYEYLVHDRPAIRIRQKRNLFLATIRVYNFIKDRVLASMNNNVPDDEIIERLTQTGATNPQIRSVLAWQKGVVEQPPSIALLEQAVAFSPDNHLARIDLYGLCLGQNMMPEALAHVRRLLDFNPEEPDFEQAAARLTEVISKSTHAGTRVESPKDGLSPSAPPLKVAVFSLDAPEQACPQLRLIEPLSALHDNVEILWGATFDGKRCTTNLDMIRAADVIVVQRFYLRKGNLVYLEQMFASGKPVIYEIDDLLTDVPDSNYLKPWILETAELLPELLPRFHAVTVSTEELRHRLERYARKIYVLPNRLNTDVWSKHPLDKSDGHIRIGYCGTPTHTADLAMIEPALHRIAREYGNAVSFLFMGCASETLAHLPGFRFVPFETTYHAYAQKLQELPLDIVLVPLADNPFNRCKSNIKWLEYSACGIAGIYADLQPYIASIEHGRTGLLAGQDPDQWYQAIRLLIEQETLRQSIAANARAKVWAEHALVSGAGVWLDVYRSLVVGLEASVAARDAKLSIIIPLYNQLAYTRRCVDIIQETIDPLASYEVILVDNASTDGTADFISTLPPRFKIISNARNLGFSKACNQGGRAARGEYLLFLNNDTEPCPGWLEPLLRTMEADTSVGAVGSKLLYPDGTIQHAGVIVADDRASNDPLVGKHIWHGKPGAQPEANQPYCYQALTAACILIRRTAFEAVQGFEEGYWNGYEDVDLCFKLGQQGWKLVYQPQSVVIHHESKSGPERFSRVPQNVERLHRTWLGKIAPDIVIQADGRVEQSGSTFGPYRMEVVQPAPSVSIVIPLYNQAQLTKACVEAVRATAGDPKRYELILVDNGSWDWTREYVKSLGDSVVVITNSDNLGFARACNQGAQAARGRHLLFLNNDTEPRAGWLDALLAGAEEDGADIVGGKLLYPNGRVQHAGVAFNKNGIGYHIFRNFPADAPAVNKKRLMQCVTAACMLVSRQFFLELGGFDEHYRNGFEDVDFCLRAGQAGRRVLYTPHAVVVHHEEQSEGRKQCDAQNMQRYLARWREKVCCDDEKLYGAEGFSVQWHDDGSCTIRQRPGEAARAAGTYPLVPLVGSYAETPLGRLSASARMKAVLKAYSGTAGAGIPTL